MQSQRIISGQSQALSSEPEYSSQLWRGTGHEPSIPGTPNIQMSAQGCCAKTFPLRGPGKQRISNGGVAISGRKKAKVWSRRPGERERQRWVCEACGDALLVGPCHEAPSAGWFAVLSTLDIRGLCDFPLCWLPFQPIGDDTHAHTDVVH